VADTEYVTAREMKEWLALVPDDTAIIMAAEREGSSFSPLCEMLNLSYKPISFFEGQVEWLASEDSVPAVVLWPLN
jgi:hypothetical protein